MRVNSRSGGVRGPMKTRMRGERMLAGWYWGGGVGWGGEIESSV